MKRFLLIALLPLAAACSDDPARDAQPSPAEPPAPILTARTLPRDASSVCAATVRSRDAILVEVGAPNGVSMSTKLSSAQRADLEALDAMVEDVCR